MNALWVALVLREGLWEVHAVLNDEYVGFAWEHERICDWLGQLMSTISWTTMIEPSTMKRWQLEN